MAFEWAGAALSFASSAYGNMMAADRQEDAQAFNAEQAAINREFQKDMYKNRYQWSVADLQAAGLNPMLAYGSTPPGPSSGATASSGTASPGGHDASQGLQAGSAAQLNNALSERATAEADKLRAEKTEIEARTPTHQVTRDSLTQGIAESQERVRKIIQETATSASSAQNIEQQTRNLQETIPQIRATVAQLTTLANLNLAQIGLAKAHTVQAGAQTGALKALEGLSREQASEVQQRVKANLPQLNNALLELERQARKLAIPGQENQSAIQESYLGALGNTLRALNPFSDFIKPYSGSSTTINYGK